MGLYISQGVTYFSPNHAAPGATFWQVTAADAWSYYDGSAWYATAGFLIEPDNVWFHGYGYDSGWDVYNHPTGGSQFYTQGYAVYWEHTDNPAQWMYYDGVAWLPTTDRGVVPA